MASSSVQSTLLAPSLNINTDERQWVNNIRKEIEEERYGYSYSETRISIFVVPKSLMLAAPNCFMPQHVALGPNHYWRPELHDMEGYKIAAAKRIGSHLADKDFEEIINKFMESELKIRSCYQRFIKCDGETLAWMLAIDTAFLLEFLKIYTEEVVADAETLRVEIVEEARSKLSHVDDCAADTVPVIHNEIHKAETDLARHLMSSHVHDYAGSKQALNLIIRDIMMVENQIPLFVLHEMLKFQRQSECSANDSLYSMFKGFCNEICPFNFIQDLPATNITKRAHLLDYIYHMILPQADKQSSDQSDVNITEIDLEGQDQKGKKESWWSVCQKILVLSRIRDKLPCNFFSKQENECSSSEVNDDNHKSMEIAIPSATELSRAGVRFIADRGREFKVVSFDAKKVRLTRPEIRLDANTEVVLRNLVAYEASLFTSGPLYFTRYTELMNGIIDTAEDVKILRKKGIIVNQLKSDEDAANLWNGMSRSVRPTEVPELDQVINDVNRYYNRRWVIKFERWLSFYVYESWQFLTFMAAVLVLLFEMCQAFCSVYDCTTLLHFKNSSQQ